MLEFEDEKMSLEWDVYCVNVHRLGEDEVQRNDPIMIILKLNKANVKMEVDTGAAYLS